MNGRLPVIRELADLEKERHFQVEASLPGEKGLYSVGWEWVILRSGPGPYFFRCLEHLREECRLDRTPEPLPDCFVALLPFGKDV